MTQNIWAVNCLLALLLSIALASEPEIVLNEGGKWMSDNNLSTV